MKVKKEELKLGDIFRTEYKGAEIYNKVVEIADTPVYDPTTFEPVYLIIIDGFNPSNGNRFGERILQEEEKEFEILYRETPEIRTALSETIKSTK